MKMSVRGAHISGVPTQRRVLIVDDHPIVRQGLRRMIETEPDLVVCGEVQTEREARAAIRALSPDVVIVDISLAQGDGLELVRDVHAQRPDLPMLVLSMHDESIYAERLIAAGASGYIMKQAASDQLLIALRQVLSGGQYLSESLANNLGRGRVDGSTAALGSGDPIERLSNRELQVLSLIGRGLSSREAAESWVYPSRPSRLTARASSASSISPRTRSCCSTRSTGTRTAARRNQVDVRPSGRSTSPRSGSFFRPNRPASAANPAPAAARRPPATRRSTSRADCGSTRSQNRC